MSLYKELSYDHDIDTVRGIQFCIMSPEEIQKRSVAEILTTETYVGTEPVKNGLFDPRMGVIDNNKVCSTCEQKNTFCPNHFGHIVLAKPVFYAQFFEYVRKVCVCVCWRCSKLLIDAESPEVQAILNKKLSRNKKFDLMYKICNKNKKKVCDMADGCGAKQPKITKEGVFKIGMEWKDVNIKDGAGAEEVKKQIFNAEDILRIFKRISDRDIELLGFHKKFNRPEWMICSVMPVPPPAVRPSVRNDTGQRMEDDLTHKLCDIVKANNALKQKIEKGASRDQLDVHVTLLQYHVATLVDNQIPGMGPSVQRTGRPLRSMFERLKSKEGRIRGNLMGKRVDFSARTVITPDPNISIDEIGVPIKIAMNLTFPEIVNKYNIDSLTKLVRNGPDVYLGAKYVRKQNPQRTIRLKNLDTSTILLDIGDVVDRHMRNGDYVLFNRQPSLHKMSMQGHRVRVMPFDTFRLNASVCKSFNADFDGDLILSCR
jgi:DNA-directed RNA polymerase II subunit RPB1